MERNLHTGSVAGCQSFIVLYALEGRATIKLARLRLCSTGEEMFNAGQSLIGSVLGESEDPVRPTSAAQHRALPFTLNVSCHCRLCTEVFLQPMANDTANNTASAVPRARTMGADDADMFTINPTKTRLPWKVLMLWSFHLRTF